MIGESFTTILEGLADPGSCCRECEDEAAEMKGQKSLPFGGKAGKAEASSGLGRHAFYRAHKLQRVGAFKLARCCIAA